MKLYELTSEFNGLLGLVADGDLTEEDIADTLDCMELDIKEKVKCCLMARQNLLASQDAIQAEISRLTERLEQCKSGAESIKDYVKHNMIAMGQTSLDCDLFKVSIRKPTKKLGRLEEDKIPSRYFKVIPETKKLDKRLLLSDSKKETIDGVELIYSEMGIVIK